MRLLEHHADLLKRSVNEAAANTVSSGFGRRGLGLGVAGAEYQQGDSRADPHSSVAPFADHDFGGLDHGEDLIADLEPQPLRRSAGDDRGALLIPDPQPDLRHHSFDRQRDDGSAKLVAGTDVEPGRHSSPL